MPDLSLALEYQGEMHYYSSHIFGRATTRQHADQVKRKFAKDLGITLIPIPFWWDKTSSSIVATILASRPDITMNGGTFEATPSAPIPSTMPIKYQRRSQYTPNYSKEFLNQVDPTGW
jgi:hypothetical protein